VCVWPKVCDAHAPYLNLWPAPLYTIFPLLISETIFGKKVTERQMRGLIFNTTLSETFHNIRRIQWDVVINIRRSSCKVSDVVLRF
jgi:hypothetical protein